MNAPEWLETPSLSAERWWQPAAETSTDANQSLDHHQNLFSCTLTGLRDRAVTMFLVTCSFVGIEDVPALGWQQGEDFEAC